MCSKGRGRPGGRGRGRVRKAERETEGGVGRRGKEKKKGNKKKSEGKKEKEGGKTKERKKREERGNMRKEGKRREGRQEGGKEGKQASARGQWHRPGFVTTQSRHPGSPRGVQGPQLSPLRLEVPTAGTAGQEDWAKHLKAVCSLDDSSEVGFSFFCLSSYTRMDCRVSCFLRAQNPLGERPPAPPGTPPPPQPLLEFLFGHE